VSLFVSVIASTFCVPNPQTRPPLHINIQPDTLTLSEVCLESTQRLKEHLNYTTIMEFF